MSEISAFGVEHTPISKALRLPHKQISFKSPARRQAASAIRRSRAKGAMARAHTKQNAAAEATWEAKNPYLAKLKHRATHRPHHSHFNPADPKELSFYNANNKLRSFDIITKSDAAKKHRKAADSNQRKATLTAVGTIPAAGAAAWGSSQGMNKLDRIERGPVGRLNNKVKTATGKINLATYKATTPHFLRFGSGELVAHKGPGMFKLAKKPVATAAAGATSAAGLIAAGHYGNKAERHDKIARRLEGRKKNRSK